MRSLVCLDTQEVFHRFSCQQSIYCGLVEAMRKVLGWPAVAMFNPYT